MPCEAEETGEGGRAGSASPRPDLGPARRRTGLLVRQLVDIQEQATTFDAWGLGQVTEGGGHTLPDLERAVVADRAPLDPEIASLLNRVPISQACCLWLAGG